MLPPTQAPKPLRPAGTVDPTRRSGNILFWMGVPTLLVSAPATLLALALSLLLLAPKDDLSPLFRAIGWTLVGGGSFVVTSLLFIVLGHSLRKRANRDEYLAVHGLRAHGTLLSIAPTGVGLMEEPVMKLVLRVEREGIAPYEATLRVCIPEDVPNPPLGTVIPLRVHPRDPRQIAADR